MLADLRVLIALAQIHDDTRIALAARDFVATTGMEEDDELSPGGDRGSLRLVELGLGIIISSLNVESCTNLCVCRFHA
ncbi:hypothetical protein L1887_22560 [Cichorium endivia]|nr:hypothetical protein L1887_22560 [Cichorium endivia]